MLRRVLQNLPWVRHRKPMPRLQAGIRNRRKRH